MFGHPDISPFMLILILGMLILDYVNCYIHVGYTSDGSAIGKDVSISNELTKSLAIGWSSRIEYSKKEVTLQMQDDSKPERRDGGKTNGGNGKPGEETGTSKPGKFAFDLNSTVQR